MNNQVKLLGKIIADASYSHSAADESFYELYITVKRESGKADIIPILISEKLLTENLLNKRVYINGEYRSYNERGEDKNRVKLHVFVKSIEVTEAEDDVNDVFLSGCLCKPPVYRLTPLGRQISDVLLAVNRGYNKSDYIPCIIWGRNALTVKDLKAGERIRVAGRIQSREYTKNGEIKIAYELSVNLLEFC